jgi:hypothetical protein
MSDLLNLDAESGRNIIGDDATPTITLENTSSGNTLNLQNAGGTGVQLSMISAPTTSQMVRGGHLGLDVQVGGMAGQFRSTASGGAVLDLARTTAVGSPTVALLKLQTSTPSGPLFEFGSVDKGVVSTASAGVTVDYGIRVKIGNTYGWIPVYHDIA